ncbi:uncharacterized protein Z519_09399 [Cladophialophora bantiana CBS 173.52]|uniref:Metallo-beta-lactamase domain-containing protein n=1 Tax=Cladophialophora bantiana (strain ATCC 10958 / CBS 173.52 / CDC B-1940 / NIH 8579) TaxID=1442370 RepID=A0A0D2HZI3_CLAB1|nr:uncharacterized protein Z519_09399 [Cladophialophora bantiana CBS 173.52]KIW89969.1 hypothetical protein Z519_09399 [Cladophialophora bantiana CBS 173.52]
MSEETLLSLNVPSSCPFTIYEIESSWLTNSTTYLIREHDKYGEFPHIYAKICGVPLASATASSPNPKHSKGCRGDGKAIQNELEGCKVIVLSDTGCGTEVPSSNSHQFPPAQDSGEQKRSDVRAEPEVWNIRTFLEYTINPGGRMPYLVMATHCHYDHIMGIGKLPPTSATATEREDRKDQVRRNVLFDGCARPPTTVLSSSYGKSFVTPYSNLQNHSLCDKLNLQAPRYDVGIWAEDMSRVVLGHPTLSSSSPTAATSSPSPPASIVTPLTILHTPGHTPDSLSWYDSDFRLLCVGDSFYVKETAATRNAKWGPEPPMPVIFDLESDLAQWWKSLMKVLDFVRERNAEGEKDEGWGDERLRVETKEDADAADGAGDDDDDGFVYIDAEDVLSAPSKKEAGLETRRTIPQSRPEDEMQAASNAKTTPEKTVTGRQTKSPPPTQQTGFDMPSPSQRGVIALPILSTPRGRLPDSAEQADDVWMMVVDPVVSRPRPQVPHRNGPDQWSARCRLEPVIAPPPRVAPPRSLPKAMMTKDTNPPARRRLSSQAGAGRRPRVRLCAAHTTLSVDAEWAILCMRRFMTRVLEGDVPCRRAEDGPRGEERWIWDDALVSSRSDAASSSREETAHTTAETRRDAVRVVFQDVERADPDINHGQGHGHEHERNAASPPLLTKYRRNSNSNYSYSVLAPLSVIEEARRSILRGPAGVV